MGSDRKVRFWKMVSAKVSLKVLIFACSALVMAVLLSACGGSRAKTKTTTTTTTEKGADGTEQPITVSTTTSTAVSKEVASSIHATGSLVANETSDVAPQTSGQVISTPVSVGALVKAGTVLARLD